MNLRGGKIMEFSKKYIQSYLFTEKNKYFISTIYRKSSVSTIEPPWFYETFAYTLDKNNKSKDWIADNSGAMTKEGALKQHIELIEKLEKGGE
jgi:hypothetical protein